MTHAYFLKAIETRIWGVPNLFIKPVWAERDTHQEAQSIPYGTPYFGLSDIALYARAGCLSDKIEFELVSTAYLPTLGHLNAINREMKVTQHAMAELQKSVGSRLPTIGERCAAWCHAFDMPGLLLPRSPGDDECGLVRLSRNIRPALDHYLADWEVRAREESVPIALQVEAMAETNLAAVS